jgi:putative transposase
MRVFNPPYPTEEALPRGQSSFAGRPTAAGGRSMRVVSEMPFPVKGVQVDGGSEFMAEFEDTCQRLGLRLFVLPPRSPKLNGGVERAQRTHTEEFYEVTDAEPSAEALRPELAAWNHTYNTVRPHQALGYLTPLEFVTAWKLATAQV